MTKNSHADHEHNHDHNHAKQPAWLEQIIPDEIIPLTIPWEKIQAPYAKALAGAASGIKLDGFRKGKVPANLAKEQLNPEYLVRQVLPQVIGEYFTPALEKAKLAAVGEPEFSVTSSEEGQAWQVEVHLAVRPTIKLGDYKKELQQAKTDAKKKIIADDAEAIKKLNENAKKAGKDETAQPLEETRVNQMATDQALASLLPKYAPGVNRLLVMRQAGQELDKMLGQLKQFNLELETYLQNSGMTQEALQEQMIHSALSNLQMEFLLEALIEAEKITADPKKVEAQLEQSMPEADAKKKKELLTDPQSKIYLEAMVKRQQLADWLMGL